jgi:hypothetical protein
VVAIYRDLNMTICAMSMVDDFCFDVGLIDRRSVSIYDAVFIDIQDIAEHGDKWTLCYRHVRREDANLYKIIEEELGQWEQNQEEISP